MTSVEVDAVGRHEADRQEAPTSLSSVQLLLAVGLELPAEASGSRSIIWWSLRDHHPTGQRSAEAREQGEPGELGVNSPKSLPRLWGGSPPAPQPSLLQARHCRPKSTYLKQGWLPG